MDLSFLANIQMRYIPVCPGMRRIKPDIHSQLFGLCGDGISLARGRLRVCVL